MMNGMPYPYIPNMPTGQLPNNGMPQMQNMNPLTDLENRMSRLERQVKRLENKVLGENLEEKNDYSASPPKDSGMYMM